MKAVIKKRGGIELKCSITPICKYSDLVLVEVKAIKGHGYALTTCGIKDARKTTRKLIRTLLHK